MSSSSYNHPPQQSAPNSAMSASTTVSTSSNQSVANKSKRSSVRGSRIPQEVRFGSYVLGATLGAGEFGKVKLGWRKDGKQPSQAAIKMIKRDSIPTGSDKESKIYREIMALKRLRHPNIVRLVEVLQNDKYIGIVLEYASGGELFEYILNHKYLKESQACRLFAQLISGVDYMHSKGIVHRDLKLENLLLDKHKNIIITDFGFVNSFSSQNNDLMKTSCGSPCYAAPELVVSSEPYEGRKVDVWSCGIILYAMLAGYLPFDDDEENPEGTNIARLYHYITHIPLKFPQYIQPTPRDLLRKIIVSDPNKRISIKEIRSHRWLAPHAPFLSVSPVEWDKNYRSSRALTQQDKINRRMSLMENPTSASLMLNKQKARPLSTHNVQASLYANPAAPQTSRTIAIPSAETSPVASPRRINANILTGQSGNATSAPLVCGNVNNSSNNNINTNDCNVPLNINNQSSDYPSTAKYSGKHSRSGSTASLVLQAVVDADVEIKKKYSNSSSELVMSTPSKPKQSQRPISFIPLLSSESAIPKNFETIKESPEQSKISPLPPPDFKRNISFHTDNMATPANGTIKLPSSRINKPRPTSYHPSYTPNSFNSGIFNSPFTPTDATFGANGNYSETSLKFTKNSNHSVSSAIHPIAGGNRSYSSTSESLVSSPLRETNVGGSGSVIGKVIPITPAPATEMKQRPDEGDEADDDDKELESEAELDNIDNTLTIQQEGSNREGRGIESPDKANNRNSYAMNLLTNAFDSLSMMTNTNNTKANSASPPIASSVSDLASSAADKVDIYNEVITKDNLRQSTPTGTPIYETNESEKENDSSTMRASGGRISETSHDESRDAIEQLPQQQTQRRAAKSNATETKSKRFSLLTFYQSIPGPTASSSYVNNNNSPTSQPSPEQQSKVVSSESEENVGLGLGLGLGLRVQHPVSPAMLPKPVTTTIGTTTKLEPMSPVADNEFASGFTKTRKVSPNTHSQPQSPAVSTSTTHSSRLANANRSSMRPLEPSNVKADRRVSGLNFNNHDKTDKVDKRDERETSTARKVMDFFKRRSMRI